MVNTTALDGMPASLPAVLKPMRLGRSLLYFGLPALLFRIFLYTGTPALIGLGLPAFKAYVVSFTVPSAVLFALAFAFYKRDGYPLTWAGMQARFRLLPMTGKDWLWAIGGFVVTFLSIGALSFSALLLIKAFPALGPPHFFPPWQQPGTSFDVALFSDFVGAPLKGNWSAAILFFMMLFFNIFGEELWWRGYILPRQEAAYGRWTWLLHGFLWLLWHLAFYPWQAFALLPICLAVPFVAQRRHNTWTAIIIHSQNAIILLLILAMIFGIAWALAR